MGIASFAMLAIFGLLPAGLMSNQASTQQTLATNIATSVVNDLQQVPSNSAIAASSGTLSSVSSQYGIDVSKTYASSAPLRFYVDQSGALQPTASTARYVVSLTLAQPPAGSRQATKGAVTFGWPAAAANPVDHVSVFLALDRN
jgi:hypothetical protein